MSDTSWQECPNLHSCKEGNRFGKGCVEDPVQSAMGGKPWHSCHCGVDSDGNPPNLRQADEITRLRNDLHLAQEWSARVIAGQEQDMTEITRLRAEVEDLGNRLHHVHRLWANNEHALRAEVEKLKAALRVYAGPVGGDNFPHWSDGYPGGVMVEWNTIDFGDAARAALAQPQEGEK